jgi:hypothetical protein
MKNKFLWESIFIFITIICLILSLISNISLLDILALVLISVLICYFWIF